MQFKWNVLRPAVLVAIATALAFTVSSRTSAQQSKTQTLTGVVSDSTCGATHTMKNTTRADLPLFSHAHTHSAGVISLGSKFTFLNTCRKNPQDVERFGLERRTKHEE